MRGGDNGYISSKKNMFREKEITKRFEGAERESEKSFSHVELPLCRHCGKVIQPGTEEYHMSKQCIYF
jgi:hypothetical protein